MQRIQLNEPPKFGTQVFPMPRAMKIPDAKAAVDK